MERNWSARQRNACGIKNKGAQEMQLLDFYKAIEHTSADMLQAAMDSNWEAVAECEGLCRADR